MQCMICFVKYDIIKVDCMTEIITKDWSLPLWYEVIDWCNFTFGPCKNDEWMWQDDYSIWFNEKNLTLFLFRWC